MDLKGTKIHSLFQSSMDLSDSDTLMISPYNFPEKAIVTSTERDFLHLHTPKAVLDMIKDGSYDSKLATFLNLGDPPSEHDAIVLREIFRKHLTHSDVGKRKGLVIPKKDAEEYFPDVKKYEKESVMLRFLDRKTRQWTDFRYCFYQSSQSYVLTTGWCKYVKANRLKEKDLIKFYECAKNDGEYKERYIMVDAVGYGEEEIAMRGLDEEGERVTKSPTGKRNRKSRDRGRKSASREGQGKEERVEMGEEEKSNMQRKLVRLFGVVIS